MKQLVRKSTKLFLRFFGPAVLGGRQEFENTGLVACLAAWAAGLHAVF